MKLKILISLILICISISLANFNKDDIEGYISLDLIKSESIDIVISLPGFNRPQLTNSCKSIIQVKSVKDNLITLNFTGKINEICYISLFEDRLFKDRTVKKIILQIFYTNLDYKKCKEIDEFPSYDWGETQSNFIQKYFPYYDFTTPTGDDSISYMSFEHYPLSKIFNLRYNFDVFPVQPLFYSSKFLKLDLLKGFAGQNVSRKIFPSVEKGKGLGVMYLLGLKNYYLGIKTATPKLIQKFYSYRKFIFFSTEKEKNCIVVHSGYSI